VSVVYYLYINHTGPGNPKMERQDSWTSLIWSKVITTRDLVLRTVHCGMKEFEDLVSPDQVICHLSFSEHDRVV